VRWRISPLRFFSCHIVDSISFPLFPSSSLQCRSLEILLLHLNFIALSPGALLNFFSLTLLSEAPNTLLP